MRIMKEKDGIQIPRFDLEQGIIQVSISIDLK